MFKKKESTTVLVERKPRKKKKPWKIIAIVVVLLLVVRFVAGIFSGGKNMLPVVETAEVTRGDITATLDTSGTIASEETRVYASPVNAQVGDVPVTVGQRVNRGDYLVTYDTESLQKSYDIAELQAKAEQATSDDSLQKSSESAGDFSSSENDIKTLQSQIDTLNAEINTLQNQATGNQVATNNNTQAQQEVTDAKTQLESLKASAEALQAKTDLSDKEKEKLKSLKKQIKEKEQDVSEKEKRVQDSAGLANDSVNIQAQITQKTAQLTDLQSKLAEAQSKNTAAEAGVLSESAKANINYTKQASRLTLEQTADSLSRAKAGVTADFDGIVAEVSVSAGALASEGAPLVTLDSCNDMCLEIPVSKYNLENLQIGQKAVITFQEQEYTGSISYISKIAQKNDAGASMVTVKAHIDTPDDNLIIGLDAKIKINLGSSSDTLLIPVSAVNSDTDGDFVYTVDNGLVEKKYVTTGMVSDSMMEIKSGLDEGDKVITTVDSTIIEGMAVETSDMSETETPAENQVDSAETKASAEDQADSTEPETSVDDQTDSTEPEAFVDDQTDSTKTKVSADSQKHSDRTQQAAE